MFSAEKWKMQKFKEALIFSKGGGNHDLLDTHLNYTGGNLLINTNVEARHPETGTLQEAIVNKIIDKSQYTVVFDDGDIATLRQGSLFINEC